MPVDKYTAVWVSHSSISDFLKCPRSYYLRNVYKDPETVHKMTIMTPPLALGQAVHEVVEALSELPTEERFKVSLLEKFNVVWEKVTGKLGGFTSLEQENEYKERGIAMLNKIGKTPGPIKNKAIKIKSSIGLPNYWLSETDNIILCGKIDWLEYLEDEDGVHIVDFKTGKNEEKSDSLQLLIYLLLASNTQKRAVKKASYWYLDRDTGPVEMKLPNSKEAYDKVFAVAQRIKLARQINRFVCPHNSCSACRPYERLLKGEGEKVGESSTRQDIYILQS